jgi:tripartite-type tricarboxylate transporter receptor subunit TctC
MVMHSRMKLPRRQFLQLFGGAAAVPGIARIARGESYPSRPITLVVPTGAGGPQDVIARLLIEGMRPSLGQPLIIDNVPGAGGTLGTGRVARAKPDGYTLAFSVSFSTHVLNAAIYALPYDVVADFTPVALVADSPQLMLARKTMPANDLMGLIAWLKANPGQASLGHIGPGSPGHVAGVLFQQQTGTQFQFVTYRSAGQAMQDMIAGHIDLMCVAPNISLSHVRAGSIRGYAVMARKRLQAAPEIPTVDEAGLPGFYASPWYALWAPKGTSRDIIDKLNAAVVAALADADLRERLVQTGMEIVPRQQQTPEALAALQKAEIEKWWPIVKDAGIKGE